MQNFGLVFYMDEISIQICDEARMNQLLEKTVGELFSRTGQNEIAKLKEFKIAGKEIRILIEAEPAFERNLNSPQFINCMVNGVLALVMNGGIREDMYPQNFTRH